VPSNSTEGFFTAKVESTGSFSGRLAIDGQVLRVGGVFDNAGTARFGPDRTSTVGVPQIGKPSLDLALHLDLATPSVDDKITGTVTQSYRNDVNAVSTVEADRAAFNGTDSLVPDAYLTVTTTGGKTIRRDGLFTVILPAKGLSSQPAGFTSSYYPQGTGCGTLRITKSGIVSFSGALADGTTSVTASASLVLHSTDPQLTWPLFAQLYNKQGFISSNVALNAIDTQSDLSATNVLWARPYQNVQHYRYGWPEVIKLDLFGARHSSVGNVSLLPGLAAINAGGNARLDFSGGLLSGLLTSSFNLSTGDVMSRVTGTDTNLNLTVVRSNGLFSGVFKHSDGTKPAFKGVIYRKGVRAGGHGFFLSTTPAVKDYSGEGGAVILQAK
jgi:hypothetical protein